MARTVTPTNREVYFDAGDIIVSKTNLKGHITYANKVFCDIAGYTEAEVLGQPHSIIRHPDMPRAVFKLLWDHIVEGHEVFAYVKNMAKNGDHYWVFAHVTPSFDANRQVTGFHSNRRVPSREILNGAIIPLYGELLREEKSRRNGKDSLAAGYQKLLDFVSARKMAYDQFIFSL